MTTRVYAHPDCERHDTGSGHPENRDRLAAVEQGLLEPEPLKVERHLAPLADAEALARAHSDVFVSRLLEAAPQQGLHAIDADTIVSPASMDASRRAAGAVIDGIDAVLAGTADNAFCAVRPPGHHAERGRAMGFCLFNAVAAGALHALESRDLERVAIVDFDVHHGNGTQDIVEDDPRILYVSSHQMPLYPGTGAASETGCGNVVNAPLFSGAGSDAFREAWQRLLLPAIADHGPDLILVSAGFDAHHRDPLAGLRLDEPDFAWITGRLCELAQRHCAGRLVSVLEGGYDPVALAASVRAHVSELLGRA